jgi:hypothetical protein
MEWLWLMCNGLIGFAYISFLLLKQELFGLFFNWFYLFHGLPGGLHYCKQHPNPYMQYIFGPYWKCAASSNPLRGYL